MNRNVITFFFISIALSCVSAIQGQSIKEINKRHEEVRSNIEQSISHLKSGDPEAAYYYMNELVVNKNDRQWRAVGNYKKTVNFWYTDEPSQNTEGEYGQDGIGVLDKITVTEKSTYTQNLEYLFNTKGQLIFFYFSYVSNSGDKPDKQEYRFYFANNKCVKFLEKVPVAATERLYKKENWENVLKEAQKYQQVFLSGFQ